MKSSILKSRIDNHISRLSQYTREAQWRLELITGFETNLKEAVVNGVFLHLFLCVCHNCFALLIFYLNKKLFFCWKEYFYVSISIVLLLLIVPKLSITEQGDHVINKMLGSSETLVYLTMKKGDIIQAKQVIKMFNLTGK